MLVFILEIQMYQVESPFSTVLTWTWQIDYHLLRYDRLRSFYRMTLVYLYRKRERYLKPIKKWIQM